MFLLDTNVISNAVRNPHGSTAKRMEIVAEQLSTSIIVAAELRFGYVRVGSERLKQGIEAILESFPILDWSSPCDLSYAAIRNDLEKRRQLIGPMDMLIAAHALALDATLVTDNEREFGRVPGLKIENWIR